MKRSLAIYACLTIAFAIASVPLRATTGGKDLQSVKGSVSYQRANASPVALSPSATISLADRDYAITGAESLGEVGLPDSSQVMVGSDTKVQLAFFNQTQIASAKFVIYNGSVRFEVRHPQGAKANYTFSTATGTIGVRGTQGDIAYNSDGSLRVNVYEQCDPNAPVHVTTAGSHSESYDVSAGHSLYAQQVNGVVRAQVEQLTQKLIDQFSPEFGVPTSWDAATGEVISYAQNQATSAVNSATGGVGGQFVPAISGLFKHKATPTPSPAPTRSTCS